MYQSVLALAAKLRDWFLASVTALYVIGYLTWSMYAWRYKLGPVPAVQSQYFVAGIVVTLIAMTIIGGAYGVAAAAFRWWPSFLERASPMTRRGLIITLSLILLACAGYGLSTLVVANPYALRTMRYIVWIVGALLLPFLWVSLARHREHFTDVVIASVLYGYLGVLGASLITQFAVDWYIRLPQALGGAKPRLAELHLRANDLSADLQRELLRAPTQSQGVVRSRPVWVLARFSDSIIVTTSEPSLSVNVVRSIELKSTVVPEIAWLE